VLALRLRGEAVSGTRAEVPFTELPQLGGADDLRGYTTDQFRDRVLTIGSVEYEWDLSSLLSASLFVDAGRVFGSLDDFGVGHMRVGYGISLGGHTEHIFGFRGSLASSIDGGLFLNLSFNQVFALDERVRRR
jgi:outer membrane protein assembly factor BamA